MTPDKPREHSSGEPSENESHQDLSQDNVDDSEFDLDELADYPSGEPVISEEIKSELGAWPNRLQNRTADIELSLDDKRKRGQEWGYDAKQVRLLGQDISGMVESLEDAEEYIDLPEGTKQAFDELGKELVSLAAQLNEATILGNGDPQEVNKRIGRKIMEFKAKFDID